MIITNAKYQKSMGMESQAGVNDTVVATIDGVVMSVSMDTNNRHYAEILKQVADGDITIEEAD
jgi:hypothetical protein